MYFDTKSYLKNNRYHIVKHTLKELIEATFQLFYVSHLFKIIFF